MGGFLNHTVRNFAFNHELPLNVSVYCFVIISSQNNLQHVNDLSQFVPIFLKLFMLICDQILIPFISYTL